jgi:asparaginyl-tRNA synthetase
MKLTTIAHIFADHKQFLDKDIILNGRVRSVRDSKTFGFIELNDGSYLKNIQIVFENTLTNFDEICKFTTGSAITVE